MPGNTSGKNKVWLSIYRLVKPYKRTLSVVFTISLLSTAVTLAEPLIYREAINDIAGLFVEQARNDARGQPQADAEDSASPVLPFWEKLMGNKDSAQLLTDTTGYTYDTLRIVKDTMVVARIKGGAKKHHQKDGRRKRKITETRIVREPHTQTHVAPRTPRQAFTTLIWAVALLTIINLIGLIFWRIGESINVKLACNIEKRFIQQTFRHVLKLPLAFFAKRSSAALHKQIDQSEEISGSVSVITKDIFPEAVSLVGILAIMFWQNYILAILSIAVVPIYVLITIRSTRKLQMSLAGYYEKWEGVSTRMQDALTGIKTVKLSGAEEREVDKLNEQTKTAYQDYINRSLLSNKYNFWQVFLTHLSRALVLSYGGYLALEHKLTPGDVVMFVAYLDMLYSPIDNLAGIWAELQQNITSIARAFRLLDTSVEEKAGQLLQVSQGRVEFKSVCFGYTEDRDILKNLSFVAEPGKVTAIVGASGAGKTTTADLLMKLFEPQAGEILIDGQKLSVLEGSSVRNAIGMVAADGAIFRGTLADNIRYKNPDASVEEVKMAALAAGMQATLERLPDGLGTLVGESGFGLSVGERQRVQIARVIVSHPAILIMDEATANLDYATEAEVKATIDRIRKHSTVIVIAHRYSMVKEADHVIVLDSGEIAEEGSPAELIGNGGWFTNFATAGEPEETDIGDEEGNEEENDG